MTVWKPLHKGKERFLLLSSLPRRGLFEGLGLNSGGDRLGRRILKGVFGPLRGLHWLVWLSVPAGWLAGWREGRERQCSM